MVTCLNMMEARALNTSRTVRLTLNTKQKVISESTNMDSTAMIAYQVTSGGNLKECVSSATSITVLSVKTMDLDLSLVLSVSMDTCLHLID